MVEVYKVADIPAGNVDLRYYLARIIHPEQADVA